MRGRLLAALLVAAAFTGCVSSSAGSGSQATMTSTTPEISQPVLVEDDLYLVEPAVEVDSQGRIFLSAIPGLTGAGSPETLGGSQLWRSLDGGQSFDRIPSLVAGAYGPTIGGGDVDLALGPSDEVYMFDLWLGNAGLLKSTDHGDTWLQGSPVTFAAPVDDRQWIDVHQGTGEVFITTNQLPSGIWVAKSSDGARTFTQQTLAVPSTDRNCICPPGSLVVDETSGNVYVTTMEGQSNGSTAKGVGLAKSTDGGTSFTFTDVSGVTDRPSVFPVLTHDTAGNLYLVTTQDDRVVLLTSTDEGETWSDPVPVDPDPGQEQIIPWIVAGDPGRIAMVWRETTEDDKGLRDDLEVAFSFDALSSSPEVTVQRPFSEPMDRPPWELREVNELAMGPDGAVHLTWPAEPSPSTGSEENRIFYARQVAGSGLLEGSTIDGFQPVPSSTQGSVEDPRETGLPGPSAVGSSTG